MSGPWSAFVESMNRRVDKRLLSAGWTFGREALRTDLTVVIDAAGRVRIEVRVQE
jgi:hypothetical protein